MSVLHLANGLWERLGGAGQSIHNQGWPRWDAEKVRPRAVTLVVAPGLGKEEAVAAALASERVRAQIAGKAVRRTVYAAGKLLNIVVG